MKSQQELSDRLEIQDLITAYSYAVDFHQWDDLDDIFTNDAELDFTATGGEKGQLPAIKLFFDRALNLFDGHQHLVATSKIELDGDTATGITLCHNPMWMTSSDGKPVQIFIGLWYRDTFLRTDAGWRIRSRVQQKGYMHGLPTRAG
jgi:hypothetical protein